MALCECGCGQETKMGRKGKPNRVIFGHRAGFTDEAFFWSRIEKRSDDECWPWTGNARADGRGIMRPRINGSRKRCYSYQYSYIIHNEMAEIPDGMMICHHCDNPSCVNPKHLFMGTRTDNVRDAVKKGRLKNQQKTHCPHGHEYTAENTYIYKGRRNCRICNISRPNQDPHERIRKRREYRRRQEHGKKLEVLA